MSGIVTIDNYNENNADYTWKIFKISWRTRELMVFRELYSRIGRIPAITAMDILIETDKICETKISDRFEKDALEVINGYAKAEPHGNYYEMFMLLEGVETRLNWEDFGIIDDVISIVLNKPGIIYAFDEKDEIKYDREKSRLDRKKLVFKKDDSGNYHLKS